MLTLDETLSIDWLLLAQETMNDYELGHQYGLTSTEIDPLHIIKQSDSYKSGAIDGFIKRIQYHVDF